MMSDENKGQKMHCPQCDKIQGCRVVPPGVLRLEANQRRVFKEQNIHVFHRARECIKCGHKFVTYECEQPLISELIQLRRKLSTLEESAALVREAGDAADAAISALHRSLGALPLIELKGFGRRKLNPKNLHKPVAGLFSGRTNSALKSADIHSVVDLIRHSASDLLALANFGQKSLNEIKEFLANMGLELKPAAG